MSSSERAGVTALKAAAAARTRTATQQADQALRRMVADNRTITIAAVAREAGVSPDFLYQQTALRQRIMVLRGDRRGTSPVLKEQQRNDDTNIVLILKQRLALERSARVEAERLLAVAHGELLALRRLNPPGSR